MTEPTLQRASTDGPQPFAEGDTDETQPDYGLGTFAWPMRIIWFGLACLTVWYVAMLYVPSLRTWMP